MILTVEQVLGIAADHNLRRTARAIAAPEKWNTLVRCGSAACGTFGVAGRTPFNVAVHLSTFVAICTCTSNRVPCNHALALLLLNAEYPSAFKNDPLPEWATPVDAHGLDFGRMPPTDPTKILRTVQRGLADLEQWLHDMIRTGLAQLPKRPQAYWDTMAARLVDTHAPKLAQAVREWPTILTRDANWVEVLLRELGQTQLLIDAFKRFDALSAETQADLCLAVGWPPEPSPASVAQRDRWHVIGQATTVHGRRHLETSWLWGERAQQFVQITLPVAVRRQPRQQFVVGTTFEADVHSVCSTLPVTATLASPPVDLQQSTQMAPVAETIRTLNERFAKLRARNFWLDAYPAVLGDVSAHRVEDGWLLLDADGYQLPLPTDFARGYHLMALSHAPLFGVWDGREFWPISLYHDNRWLVLELLPEVKA